MTPKATVIQVRDQRRQGWFSIDNEVIDRHAEELGHHGIAVYCVLARHVNNNTQQAHLGLATLTKKLKMGRAKLLETFALLEELKLLHIEHGDYETPNVYTLLEVSKGSSEENRPSSDENYPSSDENPIKTKSLKTKELYIRKVEEKFGEIPDDIYDSLSRLAELDGYPQDVKTNIEHLEKLKAKHPNLYISKHVDDFCDYYEEQGFKRGGKARAKLTTWLINAQNWSKQSNGSVKPEPKHRVKEYVN